VEQIGSHLRKTELIKDYVVTFTGDVQLLFKLLLPHKNIDTRTYQMKDKLLGKILSRCLGHTVDDIERDFNKGDVSMTAGKFFNDSRSRRGLVAQPVAILTLAEVDDALEEVRWDVGREWGGGSVY
jgi:hypothetical protein